MNTTTAYVGLGSNLGDGLSILRTAWQRIGEDERVSLALLSHPYFTEPMGMESSNWFTNAVGGLETSFSAHQLLEYLFHIEAEFGRKRSPDSTGYQDRSLDLDILYFGNTAITTSDLTLPHPQLENRLFVLEPLAEIAPDFSDPHDGVTMGEKWQQLVGNISSGEMEPQEITRGGWNGKR